MAVVRQRRLPELTLDLPDACHAAKGDRRLHFFLPPLQPEPRISDFERLGVLGHGNGGNVYKVVHRRTAAVYALKVPGQACDGRASSLEAQILRRAAGHPSIIRLHEVLPAASGGGLLLEHADAGSLDRLLHRRGFRPLPEPALASVARQALRGLAHLHKLRIAHRDIKPSNLLLSRRGELKIADFGAGKIMGRALEPCASYVGTCAYMSPERLDPGAHGGGYDACAADVWSLGLVLMELGIGRFPLLPAGTRPDWAALMCAVCLGDPPSLPPDSASPELRDFVERCLQRDAEKRWSAAKLLEHPFVAGGSADDEDRALRELVDSPTEL